MMYNKWWKNHGHLHLQAQTCGTKKTLDQRAMANVNALGIVNIGGIFVVLLCGLAFAVIVAICEFCLSSRLARAPERQERERERERRARGRNKNDKGSRQEQQARALLATGRTSLCSELTASLSSGAALVCGCACDDRNRRGEGGDSVGRLGRADCSSCSLIREHANL